MDPITTADLRSTAAVTALYERLAAAGRDELEQAGRELEALKLRGNRVSSGQDGRRRAVRDYIASKLAA